MSRRSLQITLVEPERTIDELITLGLSNRPELAADQALVQASLAWLRQEKLRPFIPSILLRGDSTPVGGTLGAGVFAGGTNGDLGQHRRSQRLGSASALAARQPRFRQRRPARASATAEHRAAMLELFRAQDRVAADVARAYRAGPAGPPPSDNWRAASGALAVESYNKNLIGLGQSAGRANWFKRLSARKRRLPRSRAWRKPIPIIFAPSRTAIGPNFDCTGRWGSPPKLLQQRMENPEPAAPLPCAPHAIGPSGPAAPLACRGRRAMVRPTGRSFQMRTANRDHSSSDAVTVRVARGTLTLGRGAGRRSDARVRARQPGPLSAH